MKEFDAGASTEMQFFAFVLETVQGFSTISDFMTAPAQESAFAAARVRFLAGLRAKAAETSRVVESYLAEPAVQRNKESLRRHLHALSASAHLFGLDKLGEHINAHIALLDTQDLERVDAYRWRSLPVRYLD